MRISNHEALAIVGVLWPELRHVLCAQVELDEITGAERYVFRPLYGSGEILVSGANWAEALTALARIDPAEVQRVVETASAFLQYAANHFYQLKHAEERAREVARAKAALDRLLPQWRAPPS